MDNEAKEKKREEHKRKIHEIVKKLKRGQTIFIQNHPMETYDDAREKDVLAWVDWLKRTYPRRKSSKEYQRIVKIYESESLARCKSVDPAFHGVPYDPTIFDSLKTIDLKISRRRRGRKPDPNIEKRNRIIRDLRAQGFNNNDICYRLDEENISLPSKWKVDSWSSAYVDPKYRGGVDSLISKAIYKLSTP